LARRHRERLDHVLFLGAGVLLIAAAPAHWSSKGAALLVALCFGAATVIALVDGDDVLGLFAATGSTAIAWAATAGLLVIAGTLSRRRGHPTAGAGPEGPIDEPIADRRIAGWDGEDRPAAGRHPRPTGRR
jgi:hypothetical protein